MNVLAPSILVLLAASWPAAASDWLAAQRWQQRLVVVNAELGPSLATSLELQQNALSERRVSVWQLENDRLRWIGGAKPSAAGEVGGRSLDGLRRTLERVAHAPGLHLFGLDGSLKASREHPDQLGELVDAIDSMPMRRQEARDRP